MVQAGGCGCSGIAGNDVLLAASRDIQVDNTIFAATKATALLAGRDLTLVSSNAVINSLGNGDAIVLSVVRSFINNAGGAVLDTSGGSGLAGLFQQSGRCCCRRSRQRQRADLEHELSDARHSGRQPLRLASPIRRAPQPGPTNPPSQVIPPSNNPTNPGVNISFQNPAGGPINVSFTPAPRTASSDNGPNVSPASLPDGVALATNNGMSFLPISMYDANQYSQFTLPGYADQAGLSAVFTMIARGVDGQRGSDYMIDTFWNGTAAPGKPAIRT